MTSNGSAPSIRGVAYMENERLYHGFRKGVYMFPCDESEKERMDIYHQLFLVARSKHLHRVPVDLSLEETRILDLGTGTGIWAIDVADLHPNAEVVGVDLVNIQPSSIPRNLRFRVPRDYESPSWTLGEDSFDLVHIRQACGSVSSWPEMYQKIYLHLKPGYGWIEHVEIDLQPRCDDGTLPEQPVMDWYTGLKEATLRASRSIEYRQDTRQLLEGAGFVEIEELIIRAPFNSWSSDAHQKEIGRWYCVGLCEGLEALTMAPYTRVFGWSPAQVKRLTDAVKESVMTRKFHGYNNMSNRITKAA